MFWLKPEVSEQGTTSFSLGAYINLQQGLIDSSLLQHAPVCQMLAPLSDDID